jgi:ABC-2 type transport system ATP-binding protein
MKKLIELVGLSDRINDHVRRYSLGMKQRLGICRVLMGCPELLILDEPTNGLDPDGVIEFREIIKILVSEEQISVMISGHILTELDKVCDRALLINQGKSVKLIDLKKKTNDQIIRIVTSQLAATISALSNSADWHIIAQDDASIIIQAKPDCINDLFKLFVDQKITIDSFSTDCGHLETDYINLLRSKKGQRI